MTNKQELENAYKILKEKYNLPSFEELDNEFEIIDFFIERKTSENHMLRKIRRRIADYANMWMGYLHNILAPTQSMILMHESESLTDSEKDKLSVMMNRLATMTRESIKVELDNEEKSNADFIIKAVSEWSKIKKEVIPIIDKILEHWEKTKETP